MSTEGTHTHINTNTAAQVYEENVILFFYDTTLMNMLYYVVHAVRCSAVVQIKHGADVDGCRGGGRGVGKTFIGLAVYFAYNTRFGD